MRTPLRFVQVQGPLTVFLTLTTHLFLLLLPFSTFFAIGLAAGENVLPLFTTRGFFYADLPLVVLLVFVLSKARFQWWGPRLFTIPLLLLCALAFLSIPASVQPAFTLYVALRWLLAFFVYLWFAQPEIPVPQLMTVFLAGLGLQALVGIMQILAQGPLGLPGELALPRDVLGAAVLLVDNERLLRAYGLTFHPNVLGGFLAVGLLLALPLLGRWVIRLLWWLMWLALFLTFSRAAWLALALTMFPALVWLWREEKKGLLVAVAGLLVGLSLAGVIWRDLLASRLTPLAARVLPAGEVAQPSRLEQFSLSERAELNEVALEMIVARPLWGVGAGNFPLAMQHVAPSLTPQYAHNIPLLLAAEVGLGGALLWLVLWLGGALMLLFHVRRANAWFVVSLLAWVALGIVALFDFYPWALDSGRLLTAMVLGLAARHLAVARSG